MKRGELAFMAVVGAAIVAGLFLVLAPNILVYHDPGAISLGASLNATILKPDQAIAIKITDTNNVDFRNVLSVTDGWGFNISAISAPLCSPLPFGIGVYQGRYALGNLSSATLLPYYFWSPSIPYSVCNVVISTELNAPSFEFGPRQTVNYTVTINGYWTPGYTLVPGGGEMEGVLHPYQPGIYTVAVGDEWGHTLLFYFRVT